MALVSEGRFLIGLIAAQSTRIGNQIHATKRRKRAAKNNKETD